MPKIFTSNKFWLGVAGIVAMVIGDQIPSLDTTELTNIVYIIIATIIGLSVEEFAKSKEK